MISSDLKTNEQKIIIFSLSELIKKIYLLRISLYGNIEEYCPKKDLFSKEILNFIEQEEFGISQKLSMKDFRLMIDCCDIETVLRRIEYEITHKKNHEVMADIIKELENESLVLLKHKKMIEAKHIQLDKVRRELPLIEKQRSQTTERFDSIKVCREKEEIVEKVDSFDKLSFVQKLMECKLNSQRDCYDDKLGEVQEKIEWYEREIRTQAQADVQMTNFWLLKFDNYTKILDMALREMFDNWSSKRRKLEILKKYRRLNQDKIIKLRKLIEERETYIEKYEKEKKIEAKKCEEKQKIYSAATLIQAVWRGTMVRKKLGPFKIKTLKKKGKDKKKK